MKLFFQLFQSILLLALTFLDSSHAAPVSKMSQIRPFQTPRLMSTGGAGVAAINLDESAVLNPATVSFFDDSTLYYQRGSVSIDQKDSSRGSTGPNFSDQNNQAIIIADTSAGVKGSVSYQSQKEFDAKRRRFTFTAASSISKSSSLGLMYRNTQDDYNLSTSSKTSRDYHQLVIGSNHVLSENFMIGAVIVDPFKSNQDEGLATLGFQYIAYDMIFLLVDVGANYHKTISDTSVYRGGIQMKFFSDFFLKFGIFQDNQTETKGNGWGVSWKGPKLNIEFANKTTKAMNDQSTLLYEGEVLNETSLSVGILF